MQRTSFDAGRPIMACAFSADERRLAVAGGMPNRADLGIITVIDFEVGGEIARLDGNAPVTRALAFHGDRLLSGGRDGCATIWDVDAGEARPAMQHGMWVCGVAWSPDGRYVATAAGADPSSPARVGLWNHDAGFVRGFSGHAGGAYGVAFSPDGEWIATSGLDGTIRLHGVEDGTEMMVLRGHEAPCWTCDVSRDGTIASGSHDRTVRLWSMTGTELARLERHQDHVAAVRWNPEGDQLLSIANDGTMFVWHDGRLRTGLPQATSPVWALAVSASGHVAIGGLDGKVQVLPAQYVW